VRFGDGGKEGESIFKSFLKPLEALGWGVHAKNLYNDYVYFWRWALWKVFENKGGPGIVSFITAASYLRGPGFAGMRQVMRETFDELWIIDLEGDNLGKTENVRHPTCGHRRGVRHGGGQPDNFGAPHPGQHPGGSRTLAGELSLTFWRDCLSGWTNLFLPTSDARWNWPLVTDLFPARKRCKSGALGHQGMGRINAGELKQPPEKQAHWGKEGCPKAFTPFRASLASLSNSGGIREPVRYAYRSFDRPGLIPPVRRPPNRLRRQPPGLPHQSITDVLEKARLPAAAIPGAPFSQSQRGMLFPLAGFRATGQYHRHAGGLAQPWPARTAEDLFAYGYAPGLAGLCTLWDN
jgi:hypothetical protein